MSINLENLAQRISDYEQRVRKSADEGRRGKFFEEFTFGEKIIHEEHDIVREEDNLLFNLITHNNQSHHLLPDIAKEMGFDGVVVNGNYGLSMVVGLSLPETTQNTIYLNVGYDKVFQWDAVKQTARLRFGDIVTASTIVHELRPSSKPDAPYGIVTFEHTGYRQESFDSSREIFTTFLRTTLVQKENRI